MRNSVYAPLLDSSKKFLQLKKVYRYKLKKISDMTDEEIITACHHFVEDNNLNDEWIKFRDKNEQIISRCF